MTHPRLAVTALLALVAAAPRAAAQSARTPDDSTRRSAGTSCPVSEGFGLSVDVPGVARTDSAARRPAVASAPRTVLDTTYTFDVAERTWTRENIEASVAAGAVGRTASGARWNACAGARASLGQATLTIRRARGTVRLYLSLESLAAAGRRATTDLPRR